MVAVLPFKHAHQAEVTLSKPATSNVIMEMDMVVKQADTSQMGSHEQQLVTQVFDLLFVGMVFELALKHEMTVT